MPGFLGVGACLRRQALAPTLANAEIYFLASDRVEEIAVIQAASELSRNLGRDLRLISATTRDIQFRDGAIYEVGAKSQFAELTYYFAASREAEEQHVYNRLSMEDLWNRLSMDDLWENRFRIGQPEFFKPSAQRHAFAPVLEPAAMPLTLTAPHPLSGLGSFLIAEPVAPRAPLRVLALARGALRISFRIVDNKASNVEFDGFTDIEFADDAADPKGEPKSGGGI